MNTPFSLFLLLLLFITACTTDSTRDKKLTDQSAEAALVKEAQVSDVPESEDATGSQEVEEAKAEETSQNKTKSEAVKWTLFDELLEKANMEFSVPEGLVEVPPFKNDAMNWERSYQNRKGTFEIRYAIRPFDQAMNQYRERGQIGRPAGSDPYSFNKDTFESIVANTTSTSRTRSREFAKPSVQKEFNADWGATSTYPLNETFGKAHSHCLLVTIHKKGAGEAYIFFMGEDRAQVETEMADYFHNLTFR